MNPYQSPVPESIATQSAVSDPNAGTSALLIVLIFFAVLHLLFAMFSILIGLFLAVPVAAIGGFISVISYLAITFGLVRHQEWARTFLIGFCYIGIIMYFIQASTMVWVAVPLIAFEVVTLIIAHNRRVRDLTRRHSNAVAYVYQETSSNLQEFTQR